MKPTAFLIISILLLGPAMNAKPATFENPILAGFHPDPSICRVGEDYYLTNSTFEYFPALPIYHSRDLVHWRQIGNALDRDSQLDLSKVNSSQGLYAPTLRHHKGTFYLTCNVVGGRGGFVVTARDPAGPWSEPAWLGDYQIDGDLFWDDDGTLVYTACEGGEQGGIAQARLDPGTFKPLEPFKQVWENADEPWDEGPHLYKIRGKYYLLAAVGGTGDLHMEQVAVADHPAGPFKNAPRPFLTHRDRKGHAIQATGHADLFQAHDGTWWTVFLGTRPGPDGYTALGRETFLAPVTWDQEGWPQAGKEHRVELRMAAPSFMEKAPAQAASREEFNRPALGPQWLYVRNPPWKSFSLDARKGHLRVYGTAAAPGQVAPLAWAGKRIPSHQVTVRTRLDFLPEREGEEAGLGLRADDGHRFQVAVVKRDGTAQLVCRSALDGSEVVLASAPLEGKTAYLEIGGDRERYTASWSRDGKAWTPLAEVKASGLKFTFTGLVMGLYATGNGEPSATPADFAWVEILEGKVPPKMGITPRPTPTPLPQKSAWRVRAGGGALTGRGGEQWEADIGYRGGTSTGTDRMILGTDEPALYQVERYGQEFSYRFSVPPGQYRVTLHFAENYVEKAGERVFGVWINGVKKINDLDILARAGSRDRAWVEHVDGVSPGADGAVEILFRASVQNAKVCALEVIPSSISGEN